MIVKSTMKRNSPHLLLMIAVTTAAMPKAIPIEPRMTGVLGIFSRLWIQLMVAEGCKRAIAVNGKQLCSG